MCRATAEEKLSPVGPAPEASKLNACATTVIINVYVKL